MTYIHLLQNIFSNVRHKIWVLLKKKKRGSKRWKWRGERLKGGGGGREGGFRWGMGWGGEDKCNEARFYEHRKWGYD